jgi:endonuclease YncB( thermonuclease family)
MTGLSLLLLAALLLPLPSGVDLVRGVAVSVASDDIITIISDCQRQSKIRLAAIDQEEKGHGHDNVEKAHFAYLAFQEEITVGWFKENRDGFIVVKVMTVRDGGLDPNKANVAWRLKGCPREQYPIDRMRYAEAEETARSQRRGLSQDNTLLATWELRQKS